MNAREARALAGLDEDATAVEGARALAASGLRRGVVTDGDAALTGFDDAGVFSIVPPRPDAVADVTGAGDAVAGITVARMLCGAGFREALRCGIAAATLTVEQESVVAAYGDAAFAARLALVGHATPVA
jgi:sugar/nucleoside kinase (ribokinase family)